MVARSSVDLLPDLKDALTELMTVYNPERVLIGNSTRTKYTTREKNWFTEPPAVIRVDGAVQTSGYTVDYDDGFVIFDTPLSAGQHVLAEFYFSPVSDGELLRYLELEAINVANRAWTTFATTDISDTYQSSVVDLAWCRAAQRILSETAMYHRWTMDGVEVDKSMLTKNLGGTIQDRRKDAVDLLRQIRIQLMGSGQTADAVVPSTTGTNTGT